MSPCGKFWHRNQHEAEQALSEIRTSGREIQRPGSMLNTYYCLRCEGWHLGHTRIMLPSREEPPASERAESRLLVGK